MECTSIAKLNNFDGKNNVKLFVACHTGEKISPKKTGIWTYSSDTNVFSQTAVYIEEKTPGQDFSAEFNLDVRIVNLGQSQKKYLLVLNRAWKPDQVSKIAALIEIDATTNELVPESVQAYSFAFSDGQTIIPNIQNVFDLSGNLIVVGMLTSDITQPIQMISCPFSDTTGGKNDLKIITCSADVP